jgi:predicted membrane chloride channel (bestrophin family)
VISQRDEQDPTQISFKEVKNRSKKASELYINFLCMFCVEIEVLETARCFIRKHHKSTKTAFIVHSLSIQVFLSNEDKKW